jgi:hypothetical protein
MMQTSSSANFFPRQLALVVLASAVAIPAMALQAQQPTDPQGTPAAQQQPAAAPSSTMPSAQSEPSSTPPLPSASASTAPEKEGFWGRVNPFARKKWVNKRIDPIKDQVNELDEVNAKNTRDIKDVDARAQAGIRNAQTSADSANQAAMAADGRAHQAGTVAQGASSHVDQLNTTVAGLDQYHQTSEVEVAFRGGQPILSAAQRKKLDDLATSVSGHQGYILDMEAHSPAAGSVGIQNSQRLAEAVKRYLVTEHQIPVYRLHSVALGNAQAMATDKSESKPSHASVVYIRLMENSLAAQDSTSPHGVASSAGAERP